MDLVSQLSTGKKLLWGAGVLLLVDSFLPWNDFSASIGDFSVGGSWNAWATGRGKVFGLALLILVIWEILIWAASNGKLTLPELPVSGPILTVSAGAITVLFGVLRFFQGSETRAWGAWLGLILLIALAAGLYLRWQEGEDAAAPVQSA